jgi:hypothetical protein
LLRVKPPHPNPLPKGEGKENVMISMASFIERQADHYDFRFLFPLPWGEG